MTTDQLARSYLKKCEDRLAALRVLMEREAHSDVIRESQEVVELALKGLLRSAGIDPPKWHDVSALLLEHRSAFPGIDTDVLHGLAAASQRLRKEREFSFYGDIDFIPTDAYTKEDATEAMEDAARATRALQSVIPST